MCGEQPWFLDYEGLLDEGCIQGCILSYEMMRRVVKFMVTSVFKSTFGCPPLVRYTYQPYMSVYSNNWNLTIQPGCGGDGRVTYRLLTTKNESGQWNMEPGIPTDRRHLWPQLFDRHFTVTRNPSLVTPDTIFVRTNDSELKTRIEQSLCKLTPDYGY